MRFVTFRRDNRPTPGVLSESGDSIVDLSAAAPNTGASIIDIVRGGRRVLDQVASARSAAGPDAKFPLSQADILAPIPEPRRNIFCVGKNYYDHAEEFHSSGFDASAGQSAIPEHPIIFTKASTTVIGPGKPIPGSADWTNSVDYEVELAVVIGSGGRNIAKDEAYGHVFGYTIVNDVTSRHLQQRHKQWFLGKNFDGFCPMGPYLVTRDEVSDVRELRVQSRVNGELRQDAVVKDLIFDIPVLIETISKVMTLLPGDIIATGTPSGVGIGFEPPKFLNTGDIVTLSITGLGELENPVA
jgi:2-keto-4-pentenoate hydratase/2-oxohepta-3-ene-1,7-dioic acid hydratase in catechol pathway